jgi:hypothetical protein
LKKLNIEIFTKLILFVQRLNAMELTVKKTLENKKGAMKKKDNPENLQHRNRISEVRDDLNKNDEIFKSLTLLKGSYNVCKDPSVLNPILTPCLHAYCVLEILVVFKS